MGSNISGPSTYRARRSKVPRLRETRLLVAGCELMQPRNHPFLVGPFAYIAKLNVRQTDLTLQSRVASLGSSKLMVTVEGATATVTGFHSDLGTASIN